MGAMPDNLEMTLGSKVIIVYIYNKIKNDIMIIS